MSSSGLTFNIARIASWSGVISVTSPVAGELPMGFVKWSNTALVTRLTLPSPGTEISTPSSSACLSLYSTITFDCSSIKKRVSLPTPRSTSKRDASNACGNSFPEYGCPRKRRMNRFQVSRLLVELCSSAASTQRVSGTLDVMNDQVPTDRAQIEIHVLIIRMLEHAAGVDFALAGSDSIDDCLFEFMMPVSP